MFRSKSVTGQYGEGEAGEQPVDDLDCQILENGKPIFRIYTEGSDRKLRAVVPFLVSKNRGGINYTSVAGEAEEKALGVKQVKSAISDVSSVAQKLATNSEESSSSSEFLSSQAQELGDLVERWTDFWREARTDLNLEPKSHFIRQ